MEITFSAFFCISVLATMALHATNGSTRKADRSIHRYSFASLTNHEFLFFGKQCVQNERQFGNTVNGREFKRYAAIELRRCVRLAIMRAPAEKKRLESIVHRKLGERRNA